MKNKSFFVFIFCMSFSLGINSMEHQQNLQNPKSLIAIATNYITNRILQDFKSEKSAKWLDKDVLPLELQEHISNTLLREYGHEILKYFYLHNTTLKYKNAKNDLDYMALSPNSEFVVMACDRRCMAAIWDTKTGKRSKKLNGYKSDRISYIRISNNNKFIVTLEKSRKDSMFVVANVWDAQTGNLMFSMGEADSIAISHNSKFIVTGMEDLRIWDPETGEITGTLQCKKRPWADVLKISLDDKYIFDEEYNKVKVWNAENGELYFIFEDLELIAVSLDSRFIILSPTASSDTLKKIEIRSLETGQIEHSYFIDRPNRIRISKDATILVVALPSDKVKIYNAQTGTLISTLDIDPNQQLKQQSYLRALEISNDNKFLVTVSSFLKDYEPGEAPFLSKLIKNTLIKIWDVETGYLIHTIVTKSDKILSVKISSGNKFIVVLRHGKAKIWRFPFALYTPEILNISDYRASTDVTGGCCAC